jgi:hypothetical protein
MNFIKLGRLNQIYGILRGFTRGPLAGSPLYGVAAIGVRKIENKALGRAIPSSGRVV